MEKVWFRFSILYSLFSTLIPVDPEGFEPSAFSMPLRRAPNCAMGPENTSFFKRTGLYFLPAGATQWTWGDSNPRPLQCD